MTDVVHGFAALHPWLQPDGPSGAEVLGARPMIAGELGHSVRRATYSNAEQRQRKNPAAPAVPGALRDLGQIRL